MQAPSKTRTFLVKPSCHMDPGPSGLCPSPSSPLLKLIRGSDLQTCTRATPSGPPTLSRPGAVICRTSMAKQSRTWGRARRKSIELTMQRLCAPLAVEFAGLRALLLRMLEAVSEHRCFCQPRKRNTVMVSAVSCQRHWALNSTLIFSFIEHRLHKHVK